MSTPLLWILAPLLLSGLGLTLMRYKALMKWGGASASLVLALSAVALPINETFRALFWEVQISDQMLVFGRRFILSSADRPVVALVFFLHFFWTLLFNPKSTPVHFVPFSLVGGVLILTAFAVDPIFYGALFFAFLALINVVLLSPPGSQSTPGVLRFLIYQILGMLFILFAAWLASWIDLNRGDQLMLARSLVMLALGFAFLLAIFPFLSWIPMVGEHNHPYLSGYLFNSYFLGVFLFGLRFITEGGWLAGGMDLQTPLQLTGVMMLIFGGIQAVFSRHLGRLSASLVIAEIGRSLLAFSLFLGGFPIYFGMVLVQALGLGIWSLSLTNLLPSRPELDLESVRGAGLQQPAIASGLALGYFTLAGLPLLAGFPVYLALGRGLAAYPVWINAALVLGSLGLITGGLRFFGRMLQDAEGEPSFHPVDPLDRTLIAGLGFGLVLLGLFPHLVFGIARWIAGSLAG